METYGEYQNLLANALSNYEQQVGSTRKQFERSLASAEEEKAEIEGSTNTFGTLVLGPVAKDVVSKGAKLVKSLADPVVANVKDQLNSILESATGERPLASTSTTSTSQTFNNPAFDPNSVADGLPRAEQPYMSYSERQDNVRNMIEQEKTEGIHRAQATTDEGTQMPQTTDANNTNPAPAEGTPTEGAVGDALETTPLTETEEGLGALLDSDPFTMIFGLILGVAGIVGGIEGANSVKNPSIPKVNPVANVSTQYGIGSG